MPSYRNADEAAPELIQRAVADRQHLLRCETEDFLRRRCADYDERRARYWQRDYSSLEAFAASVAPNRQRWQEALGAFGAPTGALEAEMEPFLEDEHLLARWVTVEVWPGVNARAVLALPKQRTGPRPLVVCQHGIGSSPERVFGFDDPSAIYHAYGRRLCAAGYAVLAPLHITEGPPRARLTRLCVMLGGTLWGLEVQKLQRLLDLCATYAEVDASRIAMYGISLGGAYTMFALPLEPRIGVGIVCAWYNDRVRKMAFDNGPLYSCFLSTNEEHILIRHWLTEFADSDLASLICPRPLLIQTGKADGIAWWPLVVEEFERARQHYERLGLGERIELDLHSGGHEIHLETAERFLGRWLG